MPSIHFDNLKNTDLIVTSNSMGRMRKNLIEHIGQEKAKRFLLRFGKDLGMEKAEEILARSGDNLVEEVARTHIGLGHVSNIVIEGEAAQKGNRITFEDLSGTWHDSFEVEMQVNNFGLSDVCSCYILSGFASGMLTILCKEEIFVKEVTCRSKGDEHCSFEVNTKQYWEENHEAQMAIYDDMTVSDELEDTYDQLLEKTDMLDKVFHFHSKLTEIIAESNDLQKLLNTASEQLDLPAFITDINGNTLYQAGSYEAPVDVTGLFQQDQFNSQTTGKYKIDGISIKVTPIYLEKRLTAYCFFLYENENLIPYKDYIYLERLAVAASLCFLNERISFETTERLKINFLDRMIYHQFENESDLLLHATYIEPRIIAPYYTLAVKLIHTKNKEELIDHYPVLLALARNLQNSYLNGLITQKEGHLILLLHSFKDESNTFLTLERILQKVSKEYPMHRFKAGVSQRFEGLPDINTSVKEAEQSLNFPNPSNFVYYKDLGVLGTVLKNVDSQAIIEVAKEEFKSLLNPDEKSKELLYTLYVYLKNNKRLERTMNELSLSIGGIKYRIQKIEKMLDTDFNDAVTTAHTLMLLEILILIDEVSFE